MVGRLSLEQSIEVRILAPQPYLGEKLPGSMIEGKYFIKSFFLGKKLNSILDIGPGSGNYVDLFRGVGEYQSTEVVSPDAEWSAIEIFAPYMDYFSLQSKYKNIIISDVYDVDWETLGNFDLIILGDVLEHMEESRGIEVIKQAVAHSTWVVISLPIIYYPQGASYGNEHEAHVEHYTHKRIMDIVAPYGVIDYFYGETIGAYIVKGKA